MFNLRKAVFQRAAIAVLMASTSPAWSGLVSFRPQDGYVLQPGSIVSDVTYYNAGGFGASYGAGPTLTTIPADSGRWQLKSSVGGFFASATDRAAMVSLAGNYGGSLPPSTAAAYLVGNHPSGRGNDGSSLAMRNDTPVGTGAMAYEYTLDQYDFGGAVPNSVTTGKVRTEFYFCPNPGGFGGPNLFNKFGMAFMDQFGAVGFEWGYAYDNTVQWRSTGTAWTSTSLVADATDWDGLRAEIDLGNDSFGIDYYDVSAGTWSTLVPAGTPLAMPMANLSRLGWRLADGIAAGQGGKNFFDDFTFTPVKANVPEPGSLALALGALLACGVGTSSSRKCRIS